MSRPTPALIRFAGDCIELELPPAANEPGHIIKFPLERCGTAHSKQIQCQCGRHYEVVTDGEGPPIGSIRGWNALLSILKARYSDEHRHSIGKKSAPVQYSLEQMLKHVQIKKVGRAAQAKPELTLEDLDL